MSPIDWPRILLLALALILPLAALRQRGIRSSRWLMMGLAWIALFLVVTILFSAIL